MITSRHRKELEEKGYTVVEGVLTEGDCDKYRQQYLDWIRDNFDEGTFPITSKGLVRPTYKLGHLAPSWEIRLKCKNAFAQLWGTDRLLSSFDCVAIGRPPEQGVEEFWSDKTCWLHIDESVNPDTSLRCYQGAVYLEHADEDDWTFQVLEGSHKLYEDFWRDHPDEYERSMKTGGGSSHFTPDVLRWWANRRCPPRRLTVPKGSLVLWDSRTAHANANPIRGRKHPDRWRWILILSMWPVSLVGEEGVKLRKKAYDTVTETCHDVRIKPFENLKIPPKHPVTELPEIARTLEARRLAGAEPYPG
ncbi:hypothetical protein BaRGS_00003869 [Batillaria attramentaria]|uniref:Phytanoyl-CoA dioxygenase n=1 Tax=Batillaria attramentaria TaxID=370345 RepID=A0ABD0M0J2_9CAEN